MPGNKPTRLALRRMLLGLEQKQIASLLGQKTIYQYGRLENGQRAASFKDAIKLSLIFKLPITTLFDDYFRQCREELEKSLAESALANRVKLENLEDCDYLRMMNSKHISPENADKVRHHIKALIEERANKILNH